MDTTIKAEWYDLDDADREGFLAWLHGHHLPALQARPGYIWIGHYQTRDQTDDPRHGDMAGQPQQRLKRRGRPISGSQS